MGVEDGWRQKETLNGGKWITVEGGDINMDSLDSSASFVLRLKFS